MLLNDAPQSGAMLKRSLIVAMLMLSARASAQTTALPFVLKQVGPGEPNRLRSDK